MTLGSFEYDLGFQLTNDSKRKIMDAMESMLSHGYIPEDKDLKHLLVPSPLRLGEQLKQKQIDGPIDVASYVWS